MPSHYPNQCWLVVDWNLGNKFQWNLYQNAMIFFEEREFEFSLKAMNLKMSFAKWQPFCLDLNVLNHVMETFSALLAICAGNSPVPGEFPAQRPVTRSFDVFFDLRLNKRLSKQPWGWWFETPAWSLWRHRNDRIYNQRHQTRTERNTALSWSFSSQSSDTSYNKVL